MAAQLSGTFWERANDKEFQSRLSSHRQGMLKKGLHVWVDRCKAYDRWWFSSRATRARGAHREVILSEGRRRAAKKRLKALVKFRREHPARPVRSSPYPQRSESARWRVPSPGFPPPEQVRDLVEEVVAREQFDMGPLRKLRWY